MKQFKKLILSIFIILSTGLYANTVNMAPIISYLLSDTITLSGLDIIKAYADDQANPIPTLQDYEDAGVLGVTLGNIENINETIASLTSIDVDTMEEVQAIVDDVNSNVPPIANAGPDQNVPTLGIVTLDGSGSSDEDTEDVLTYLWSWTAKPIGSSAQLSSVTDENATFVPDGDGIYELQLIVNDGTADSVPDTVTVTAATANIAPVADAGTDTYLETGLDAMLNGSASSDANIGDTLTYSWSITSKPSGSTAVLLDPTSINLRLITDIDGPYVIQLIVNDGTVNSAPDTVTVTAITVPAVPTHNDFDYTGVISPYTGRIWLDRNLGASNVCRSYDDIDCYGGYYQWGRNTDGHQKSNSSTTTIVATDINNAGSLFITAYDWVANDVDADASQRVENWNKTDGTSVCPVGYRVPSSTELANETIVVGVASLQDSFNNFLKIPSAGYRSTSASLGGQTYEAHLWTTTLDGSSYAIHFVAWTGSDDGAWIGGSAKFGQGEAVRCIKDY